MEFMKRVQEFLSKHHDGKSPVLLGYSGGPDSKALLYSLVDWGKNFLHVAHVDHGWREESAEEASKIGKEMEELRIPFYSIRLEKLARRNKEALAREERFSFFRSLFAKNPFQALILGHHADDLAETLLKRIFEGAHLPLLGGMNRVAVWDQMPIWRPLLPVKKKDILAFLDTHGLQPFLDATNQDPSYLRSRLRMETIPFLERSFGKNIFDNLCLLSERSQELKLYLDQKIRDCKIQREDWGVAVCCQGFERLERRHLLQKIGLQEGLALPRTILEPVLDWVDDTRERKKIYFQSKWIVSGRGWVFFLHSDEKRTFSNVFLLT